MPDIGDNNPPPLDAHSLHIEDLIAEAQNFLDGAAINSQGQADAISALLDNIRKARKAADEQRATEKKPHDDAGKAVQAAWKPLLDRCDLAASVAKKALTPWLEELDRQQRVAAQKAREEAEEKRIAALEAEKTARGDDLAAQEIAVQARKDADKADRAVNKADKAKAHATGGSRAIGLRASWTAEVTDPLTFGKWLWANRRADYLEWLDSMASEMTGTRPVVPGILYHEQRTAA